MTDEREDFGHLIGFVPRDNHCRDCAELRAEVKALREELADTSSFAAEVAGGITHASRYCSEDEPCVRCQKERAEAEVETLRNENATLDKEAEQAQRSYQDLGLKWDEAEERAEKAEAEAAYFRKELGIDRAVCICGCPPEDHELYDDGESCEHEDHQCIRVCMAARDLLVAERTRAEKAEAENAQLKERVRELEEIAEKYRWRWTQVHSR